MQLEPAGFRIRAAARLIDLLVNAFIGVCAAAVLILVATIVTGGEGTTFDAFVGRLGRRRWLSRALILIAYHGMFEGIAGTTIGKRLLQLHVIDTELRPITFAQGLKRSAIFPIDSFFFGLVAWWHMRTSPARQRLGDEWADTQVVARKSLPPELLPSTQRFLAAMAAAFAVTATINVAIEVIAYVAIVLGR